MDDPQLLSQNIGPDKVILIVETLAVDKFQRFVNKHRSFHFPSFNLLLAIMNTLVGKQLKDISTNANVA